MSASENATTLTSAVVTPSDKPLPTQGRRVSGRVWKQPRKATNRSTMSKGRRQTWEQRQQERLQREATKAREQELKQEKTIRLEQQKEASLLRKKMAAEKERLAQLQAVLSAKKLQRRKRKELKAKARQKH
ncbi:hypothetical protein IWQ62_000221 [Dispira parvispora]|uniref:rRNA-processing protein n=1 Tax=Dispira parvispora TaxID=1520584 RepID=A0A9W8E6A8_9FUNG|nr:hypothetical protein IWQ62_000221 [Dispira parvispora]